MEPTRLFPIIVLLSLVTVEYSGWVLLVPSLAHFDYLGRTGYSVGVTIDARRPHPAVSN